MANLLEQYEQTARQTSRTRSAMPEPITPGFINARLEDDTPIFNKQKINYDPPDPITHLCVANNYLVVVLSSNILFRIDLEKPNSPDEVELPKSVDDQVSNVYIDPKGHHLIISMASSENYYLARTSKKPRALGKFKGHQITAVGWNKYSSSETSTGEILLGTSKGLIFETEFNVADDNRFFQSTIEQYVKQLYTLAKDKPYPVTGLEFNRVNSGSATEVKYFIIATLPGRLYQFIGSIPTSAEPPIFTGIFHKYESLSVQDRFLEIPGNFGYGDLRFFSHSTTTLLPKSFAWMTGPGIYYGNIDATGTAGQDSVTTDTKLIPYPTSSDEPTSTPQALVLTEFHVLLLCETSLKAICTLNDQLVYEDVFTSQFGRLKNIQKDPVKGTIWAFSSKNVFKYKIIRESRDVWQMYLDKNEFELASRYCQDNPANMNRVLTKKAEHYFKDKRYEDSAEIYAQTQNSFEEISLKFINLEQKEALRTFLLRKLSGLQPNEKTQTTMLITWLIELYLNQLGQLKEAGNDFSQEYDKLQEQFRKFLAHSKVKECVSENKSIVYDLIASHGDVEDMVFFAVLIKDYERVITHHLQHEDYKAALDVLSKQEDTLLYYKFSPILMQNAPSQMVDVWISKKDRLDPRQLIPALVQYDHQKYRDQGNEAIRYLEYCIQMLSVGEQAIHNYLLSLYAKLQPDKLMKYLEFQGTDSDNVHYDLKYGLRLCSEHSHNKACVHIYSTMGLYAEAVDLALVDGDVDMAKVHADKPEDDEELRKKLWLKIARHVVEKEKDIKRAMEFIQECELLKIEDILPFFPDFVTIDHFKDAICNSLEEYNQHIDRLKEDMEEATDSAKEIRNEIQAFRNKFSFVRSTDKCSSCSFPLMTRSFYLFPCMHKFHSDCLISEVLPHLSNTKRSQVEELQRKLASKELSSNRDVFNTGGGPIHRQVSVHTVKEDLDSLVAAECIYCGDLMIRCIDKPFIDPQEYDSVMQSWL